jgi:hypothetical protein
MLHQICRVGQQPSAAVRGADRDYDSKVGSDKIVRALHKHQAHQRLARQDRDRRVSHDLGVNPKVAAGRFTIERAKRQRRTSSIYNGNATAERRSDLQRSGQSPVERHDIVQGVDVPAERCV